MHKDTLREIDACLRDVSDLKETDTDAIRALLFTKRNNVAVRAERILRDPEAKQALTEAAGRTWQYVTDAEGKARQLWGRLAQELVPLARRGNEALEQKVDLAPKGLLASLFSPKHTCREVALRCWDWCQNPLAIKADLIFPYHGTWGLLAVDKAMWRWIELPHAGTDAVPIRSVGDFLADLVVNRLGTMVHLVRFLANLTDDICALVGTANWQSLADRVNWQHELGKELLAVRDAVWNAPDAEERSGAMAFLQTYLAGERYRSSFEGDWLVIPWPTEPENMVHVIIDRPEQKDLFPGKEIYWIERRHALGETFDRALKERPAEVLSFVKRGLEWLASSLAASTAGPGDVAQTATNEQKKRGKGVLDEHVGNLLKSSPAGITSCAIAATLNKNYDGEYRPTTAGAVVQTQSWKRRTKKK